MSPQYFVADSFLCIEDERAHVKPCGCSCFGRRSTVVMSKMAPLSGIVVHVPKVVVSAIQVIKVDVFFNGRYRIKKK